MGDWVTAAASVDVALAGVDDCCVDVLALLPPAPALLLSALLPNLPSPDDLVGAAAIEGCCVDVL